MDLLKVTNSELYEAIVPAVGLTPSKSLTCELVEPFSPLTPPFYSRLHSAAIVAFKDAVEPTTIFQVLEELCWAFPRVHAYSVVHGYCNGLLLAT